MKKRFPAVARCRRPATRREKAVKAAKAAKAVSGGGRTGFTGFTAFRRPTGESVDRPRKSPRRRTSDDERPQSMELESVSHGDRRESIGTEGHRGSDAPDGPLSNLG